MEYFVKKADPNKRLDVFLPLLNLGLTRSAAQRLIEEGNVLVNDKPAKASLKLKVGDKIFIDIPPPKKLETEPEDIKLDILYEDPDIIVINKPYGMVVHPACGNYLHTLVNALLFHCGDLSGIGGVIRPGIVHRLDKGTSGAIVVAKNDFAHSNLSRQFKDRKVKKKYIALVKGEVKGDKGIINENIGRHPVDRKKMTAGKSQKTREAVTKYKIMKRFKEHTLLEVEPKTGRTHQIRVHLSHIGYPIYGDPVYGKGQESGRMFLHAETLGFNHPTKNVFMEFLAPMPEDLKKILEELSAKR